MPEQITNRDRPELGFVSVADYLNANRGTVDRDYQQAQSQAAGLGQSFAPLYGGSAPTIPGMSTPPTPGSTAVEGVSSYLDQARKAQEMGRTLSDPGALASSPQYGGDLTGRGPGTFSAALQFAKYGNQYQKLGDYLKQFTPEEISSRIPKAFTPTPDVPEKSDPQPSAPLPRTGSPDSPPTEPEDRPGVPNPPARPPSGGGGTGGQPPGTPDDEERRRRGGETP